MAQYTRGRISVTNGSAVVTGTDTLWYTSIEIGDVFKPKNVNIYGTVASVESDTQITLNAAWAGSTITNSEYQISRDFTPTFNFYEVNPGDVNWAYYMTQNLRKIDNLFDIMSAGVISADLLAARDEAVTAVGNVDLSVTAAANSATAAATSATAAATSATAAATSATTATTKATEASTSASSAATSATNAATSEANAIKALSISNYKGDWTSLTGALAMPASVSHNGSYWQLNQNVSDVTTQVPGTATVWTDINMLLFRRVIATSGTLVFDSVASMSLDLSLKVGDRCETINYYASIPGGGAKYIIVVAATGSADGFRYFDLSNGLQAELVHDGVFRAKQAGVQANGTDDTEDIEAFLALLSSNDVAEFDPGFTYSVGSVSVVIPENVTIKAYGAAFNCLSDAKAFELNTTGLADIHHIKWFGGVFQNTAATKTLSNAIAANKCPGLKVEDAEFYGFKDALAISNSRVPDIENNIFDQNTQDIVATACTMASIEKNLFKSDSSTGVSLIGCAKTSISKNDFKQTVAGAGCPIDIDATSTDTNIGVNEYADAIMTYDCPASEIHSWPYV